MKNILGKLPLADLTVAVIGALKRGALMLIFSRPKQAKKPILV